MPQPFTLPLNCPSCGRPLTVKVQLQRHFAAGQAPSQKVIACPYAGCTGHIDPVIHGEVMGIWQGHGPAPFGA